VEEFMKKIAIAFLVLLVASWSLAANFPRWVKGNTHTHTNCSDGDEYPPRVARWYQDHGYQFLVITDHDMVTATAPLDPDGNRDDFIVIPGDEISLTFQKRQAHVCALNPSRVPAAQAGDSMSATLQNAIDGARQAGAVAVVNHPNRKWSISAEDLRALRGVRLFEVLNLHRESNNFSAGGRMGGEELWDRLLSEGMLLYGVAADDTHDFQGEFMPGRAHPGKGWVVVRVAELTPAAVCAALEKGDFYASTGVELADVQITDKEYRLTVKPYYDTAYTTRFIGRNGTVLKEEFGLEAAYAFTGDEQYVRARVISSGGELALCQPVFVKK
jgi:hypothetical protein